jgi:very-short-patch-repair endonuclease
MRDLRKFEPQAMSKIIWSFAKGDVLPDAAVLDQVQKNIESNIMRYKVQEISIVCWAMVVFERASVLFPVTVKIVSALEPLIEKMAIEEKVQMYQFAMEARLTYPKEFALLFYPFKRFLNVCKEAMILSTTDTKSSQLHMDVSTELNRMGFMPVNEFITDIGYVVDIAIEKRVGGKSLLIEVDGPSHFINKQETMQSKMKKRHLRQSGYDVVSIPYFEWNQHLSNPQAYLLNKISTK